MNKIIPCMSVLVLCGCSAQQLKTSDLSITTEAANRPVLISESGQNQGIVKTESKPSNAPAKRQPIDSQTFRHHSVLPVKRPAAHPDHSNHEFLIPRLARYIKQGVASWYGPRFHGRKTATGEIFNMYAMTAAHKTLPIPSYAQVTNLENKRSVIVRINDRGPYVGDRLLDLSYAAAKELGFHKEGLGKVEIVALTDIQSLSQLPNSDEAKENSTHSRNNLFTPPEIAPNAKKGKTSPDEPEILQLTYQRSAF